MKPNLFLIASLTMLSWPLTGQNLEWARQVSGATDAISEAVVVDGVGNVYITGFFEGTADFDPGPGVFSLTAGGKDIFVSKLDSAGNLIWAKQMGGPSHDEAHAIAVDNSGNVYTTGYFRSTADFDPGVGVAELIATTLIDAFISKLDSAGNFVWVRQLRGGNPTGTGIAVDDSGSVYATGNFEKGVDLDPGSGTFNVSAGGNEGVYLCKLDSAGDFAWGISFGRVITINSEGLAIDASRNLYVVGNFRGEVDFDPGPGVFELPAGIFVAKYDSDGSLVWARRMGGTGTERPYGVATDADGNVYTTGGFSGTADFDPGPAVWPLTAEGNFDDIFVSKLTASGNFAWARRIGGSESNHGYGIAVDAAARVYVTGRLLGTVDFDPGPGVFNRTSNGVQDGFITSLDGAGNFLWAQRIGGPDVDWGRDVALDSDGAVHVVGTFIGSTDFAFDGGLVNLTSGGDVDMFVAKYDPGPPVPPTPQPAQITSPQPGTTLAGTSQQFSWTAGVLVTEYRFRVGSTPGTSDIYGPTVGTQRAVSVSGLPNDGRTLYARLESRISGEWSAQQVQYTAASAPSCSLGCSANVPAAALTGSATLFQSSATASNCAAAPQFSWTFGDATPGSTAQIPVHAYSNAGTYNWSLSVSTTGKTCQRTGQIQVSNVIETPEPRLAWAIPAGSTGNADGGRGVTVDQNGYVYFAGDFSETVDFDPGPGVAKLTAADGTDIFVSKFDSAGNFVWVRQFGGESFDQARAVAVDRSGNVYVTGFLFSPASAMDVFVSKLSSTGNVIWTRQMGGPGNDIGTAITIDDSANIFVIGEFSDIGDFDPGPSTSYLATGFGNDAFVVKLDSSGNFEWAFQLLASASGESIASDADGNIYATGSFSGTADFDPGPGVFNLTSVTGGPDIFIAKYSSSGQLDWARQLGGSGFDVGTSVALGSDANVYTTGLFEQTADFDPGPNVRNLTAVGAYDAFVSKLDSAGNFVWVRQLGGEASVTGYGIAVDSSGGVSTTGQFAGTADFDPGAGEFSLTASGSAAVYLSKLDSAGNFAWARQIGGPGTDWGFDVAAHNEGVYIVGEFEGAVDFDPDAAAFQLVSAGGLDGFLAHYKEGPLSCSLTCSATAPPSSTVGSSVSFQGSAQAANCSASPLFSWTFGDGSVAQGQKPAYSYASSGVFDWSLEVAVEGQICRRSGSVKINGLPIPAQIVTPTAGARLDGASQKFEWTPGVGVSEYRLLMGSSLGGNDLYFKTLGTQTSAIVSNLPTDGRIIYARLESRITGEWYVKNTNYLAALGSLTPTITEGGIVSANLVPKVTTISPGSIFSVFGENFTTETVLYPNLDEDGRLARSLGGVCIEMNGERLPIFAVTPGQINAQASAAQALGPAEFIVISNCDSADALIGEPSKAISSDPRGLASSAANALVEAAAPSFFLFPPFASDGLIAARFNADAVAVAPYGKFHDEYGPSRPAVPGDIVVLYGTGWGENTARLDTGELATGAAELLGGANPMISFGGVSLAPDDVLYVGLTPGTAGLYQAAIRVPENAHAGNNQVILTVYGKSTPAGPVIPVTEP